MVRSINYRKCIRLLDVWFITGQSGGVEESDEMRHEPDAYEKMTDIRKKATESAQVGNKSRGSGGGLIGALALSIVLIPRREAVHPPHFLVCMVCILISMPWITSRRGLNSLST